MFSKLAKYETDRTPMEAFGFYLACLLLALVLGFVVGAIAGTLNPDNPSQAGVAAGSITSIFMCSALAVIVATKKSLFSSYKVLVIIAFSVAFSVFIGALGGLVPVAYLTTVQRTKA